LLDRPWKKCSPTWGRDAVRPCAHTLMLLYYGFCYIILFLLPITLEYSQENITLPIKLNINSWTFMHNTHECVARIIKAAKCKLKSWHSILLLMLPHYGQVLSDEKLKPRLPNFLTHDWTCFTFVRAMLHSTNSPPKDKSSSKEVQVCQYQHVHRSHEWKKIRKFGIHWNLYMLYIVRILRTSGFWNLSRGNKPTRSKVVTWKS